MTLAGLSRSDMEHLLEGFLRLVADRDRFAGRDPFEISAKYLLGSSNILAKLGKALSAAGISDLSFGTRPRHMLGGGPARSKFTLLVENRECFERLIGLGLADRITVIATFGYGITWSGVGVEGRLDRIKIARVAGTPPPTLAAAIAASTCSFWGDLDLAGLDIFIKLRGLVPHLALSALYSPMLVAAMDSATSHPYCTLVDKLGQIETVSCDGAVTRLAAACRLRAVDQEYVSDQDILSLADQVSGAAGRRRRWHRRLERIRFLSFRNIRTDVVCWLKHGVVSRSAGPFRSALVSPGSLCGKAPLLFSYCIKLAGQQSGGSGQARPSTICDRERTRSRRSPFSLLSRARRKVNPHRPQQH